jgi:hypothetical protein
VNKIEPAVLSDARSGLLALKQGGWNRDAVLNTPWFVLSDWLRDHGHESGADALSDGSPVVVNHVYEWAKLLYDR